MNDWNAIKAEYIAGGISQRKLAEKYGISFNTLKDRANAGKWNQQREQAHNKITTKTQQKIVDSAADNATQLQRAYGLILKRVNRLLENMPEDGTKIRKTNKGEMVEYDLATLLLALEKLQKLSMPEDENALKAAKKLLEGVESVID